MNDTMFSAQNNRIFYVNVPIVQYNINPANEEYKDFYLDDQNYFPFSGTQGVNTFLYIEEQHIETDTSIMPYTSYLN